MNAARTKAIQEAQQFTALKERVGEKLAIQVMQQGITMSEALDRAGVSHKAIKDTDLSKALADLRKRLAALETEVPKAELAKTLANLQKEVAKLEDSIETANYRLNHRNNQQRKAYSEMSPGESLLSMLFKS